jgi:hypothetical protein
MSMQAEQMHKKLGIVPDPGRQNMKTLDAGHRPNNKSQTFLV